MIKRRFDYNNFNIKNITITRLVFGFLIGLLVVLSVYSFLYVFRETFRILQVGLRDINGSLLFDKTQRFRYNFLCAGLATILGNSSVILFFLGRPQKIFNKHSTKRKRIINDQIFLSFNLMYWLAKVMFFIGLSASMFLDSNFIQDFYYAFLLLLLILYLESSKTILQLLGKNKFKVWLGHFLLLLGVAFALTNFNPVNYHRIDHFLIQVNPRIELPVSEFNNYDNLRYGGFRLYRFFSEDGRYFVLDGRGGKRIPFEDLYDYLNRNEYFERHREFKTINLITEKETPMKAVKRLEEIFYRSGYRRIRYVVISLVGKKGSKSLDAGISMEIIVPDSIRNIHKELVDSLRSPSFEKQQYKYINVIIDSVYSIGNKKDLNQNELISVFENTVDSNTVFQYKYSEKISYQNYIDVISAHKQAIYNKKEQEGLFLKENSCHDNYINDTQFNICYDEFRKEARRLRKKYPILIKEEQILD